MEIITEEFVECKQDTEVPEPAIQEPVIINPEPAIINPVHVDRHKYVGGSEMAKVLNMSSFKQNNRESAMQSKLYPDYGKYIRACSFGILFEELH